METKNSYLVIEIKDFLNSSGQEIETCSVKVFSNLQQAKDYAISQRTQLEKIAPRLFGGSDVLSYIDMENGKEIIDIHNDVLFTDKSSSQAAAIMIRTEEEVCNLIINKVEEAPNHNLPIEDAIYTPMYEDDDEEDTKYLPVRIYRRYYDDEAVGSTDYIYDVEMKAQYSDGSIMNYVESLECIGFRTLANIYVSLQNS